MNFRRTEYGWAFTIRLWPGFYLGFSRIHTIPPE